MIFTQSLMTEIMKTDTALRKFTVIFKDTLTFVLSRGKGKGKDHQNNNTSAKFYSH
jgi:hypothetical protein